MVKPDLIAVARGDRPADLVLQNANLVNVYAAEIYQTDIAIYQSWIVGMGPGYADSAREVIDVAGKYVAPGFIDAHVHIESSMCLPREFARAVLPHGVTSVVTDPHEIANVLGLEGIRLMLDSAKHLDMSMYVMASSCVPASHLETAGADLEVEDIEHLRHNEWVLGLAEMMNYPGVVMGRDSILAKIEAFDGLMIDGHAPALSGMDLNAYVAAGIHSDHECTSVEEAREKLRLGLTIFIREATNAHNLHTLLPLVTPQNSRQICFCTDDRQASDLIDQGSIDHMVREAVEFGLDPITAIQMGTINTAEYFNLTEKGIIAPGKRADLFVFSDLNHIDAELVYRGGKLVAEGGRIIEAAEKQAPRPLQVRSSMNVNWDGFDLNVPNQSGNIRVIGSIENQLVTEHKIMEPKVMDGYVVADPKRDILKMAVIERHKSTGNVGRAFIHGIGLSEGAIAGTVAHDHHNLVVIGADDASMLAAAKAVEAMGGGLVAVRGDEILAKLPLPVGGLMSDKPVEEVRAMMDDLLAATDQLGSDLHDPFMAMSFMALEVIPSLKLTDMGLVDVETFQVVGLFIDSR